MFSPSVELRNAIVGCEACASDGVAPIDRSELCATHRARMNVELCSDRNALEERPDERISDLMSQALADPKNGGRELLSAFRRQASALNAVWEAYRRGAASLPDSVASSVETALVRTPRIISGVA